MKPLAPFTNGTLLNVLVVDSVSANIPIDLALEVRAAAASQFTISRRTLRVIWVGHFDAHCDKVGRLINKRALLSDCTVDVKKVDGMKSKVWV